MTRPRTRAELARDRGFGIPAESRPRRPKPPPIVAVDEYGRLVRVTKLHDGLRLATPDDLARELRRHLLKTRTAS